VRGIPGGSSPSVALGEGFPECFGAFPECIWHSGKQLSPVVDVRYQEPHNDINLVNEPLAVGSRGGEPAHRPWCRRGFIPSADAHMCGS
jgi:hypothetical protein